MKEPGYHTRSLILQRPAKVNGEVDRTQPEICVGALLGSVEKSESYAGGRPGSGNLEGQGLLCTARSTYWLPGERWGV